MEARENVDGPVKVNGEDTFTRNRSSISMHHREGSVRALAGSTRLSCVETMRANRGYFADNTTLPCSSRFQQRYVNFLEQ